MAILQADKSDALKGARKALRGKQAELGDRLAKREREKAHIEADIEDIKAELGRMQEDLQTVETQLRDLAEADV